jgi:hypothetical protein
MDKSNGKSYMEAVRPRAATTSLPITRAFECATERDRHSRSRSSEPASGYRPPRKQSHRRGRPCSTGQLRRRARSLPRRSPGFSLPRTDRNRLLLSLRLCVFFPTFRYQILPSSCSARKRSGEEPGAARPRRSVERGPRRLHKDDRPSRSPASHVCRTRSSLCRLAAFQRWRRGQRSPVAPWFGRRKAPAPEGEKACLSGTLPESQASQSPAAATAGRRTLETKAAAGLPIGSLPPAPDRSRPDVPTRSMM